MKCLVTIYAMDIVALAHWSALPILYDRALQYDVC